MFSGQNNYIVPPFVFVNIPTGANPLTTELKMYLDATRTASYSGTETSWSDISGVTGLLIGSKGPNGSQEHYIGYTWNQYDQYPQTLLVPNNKWSMIAVSISSTKADVYLFNAAGSATHSHTYSHAASNNNKFYIDRDPICDPCRNYKGKIGTVMIYNAALTSQNITDIYNAQKEAFGL